MSQSDGSSGGSGKHANFDPFDSNPRLNKGMHQNQKPLKAPATLIEKGLIKSPNKLYFLDF
jgi:hypothetical protein